MRKWMLGVVALCVTLTSAAAPAFSGAPALTARAAVVDADLDRNKLFENLEAVLAKKAPSGKVSVIVRLYDSASRSKLRALERQVGSLDVTSRFRIVRGFAAKVTKAQAQALAQLPDVVHVERNSRVHVMNDSAQSSFGVTAARAQDPTLDGNCENATDPTCAAGTYGPADLVAAVIDTGIDGNHVELNGGKVIGFADCVGGTCLSKAAYDDHGHGTHVAGTIAGDGEGNAAHKGAAPLGALVGVKVLNAKGSGSNADVVNGIQWVIDNRATYGIEAINLSLGSGGCSNGTDATSVAVNRAVAAGIVVAVAAGNNGPGTCTIGSPAAAADAITVGAMTDMGELGFSQAYFSSRGPTADGRIKPDISSPGVRITSAQANSTNLYTSMSGTSMATPFTAGVSLLMLDANPTLTPLEVKTAMRSTAIDWARGGNNRTAGTTGPDNDYGAGRLDAHAALKAVAPSLGVAPAMPVHELKEGSLSGTGAQVDYALGVTDTQFPVAATMIMPALSAGTAVSPDFDLYLYDPSGTLVDWAESIYRQEEVNHKPAVTGTYTLRVRSYSGSGRYFVDVSAGLTPPPPPSPDFTISASPSSASTNQGGNVNYSVSIGSQNGYAGTVNLSVAGLPSGASATFTPPSVAGSGTSTLAVSTSASTPVGSYPLSITGTDRTGSPTRSTSVTLQVTKPDFTISASPSSASTSQGGSVSYSVSIGAVNGYTGTVDLAVTGLPAGATSTFTPRSVTGSGSSTLAVATASSTPAGSYALTISGTDTTGSPLRSTSVTLVVNPPTDFTLSVSPSSMTRSPGDNALYDVKVTPVNGYAGTVDLSVTGVPPASTATWNSSVVTGGSGTRQLTIETSSSTPLGSFTLTIKGKDRSGSPEHTATVTLVIEDD